MIIYYVPVSVTFTFLGILALASDPVHDALWYSLLTDIFVTLILYTLMAHDESAQLIA